MQTHNDCPKGTDSTINLMYWCVCLKYRLPAYREHTARTVFCFREGGARFTKNPTAISVMSLVRSSVKRITKRTLTCEAHAPLEAFWRHYNSLGGYHAAQRARAAGEEFEVSCLPSVE